MDYILFNYKKQPIFKENRVACIGYFDGIHLGHRSLIDKTIAIAKEKKCKSALITFSPDPWVIIKGMKDIEHLTSLEQRVSLAKSLGIDEVIVVDFTIEVCHLSSSHFVKEILKPLKLNALICGFDFHYGFKGEGNVQLLRKEAEALFEVFVIDSINRGNEKISTSRISNCLKAGDITQANELLGYPYFVEGNVIKGNQKGRTIGFPTANIQLSKEVLLPKVGVYKGRISFDDKIYVAMINLGHNPTFNYIEQLSMEVHIPNFEDDLYGKVVKVTFLEFLREEIKFETIDQLIGQLEKDRNQVISVDPIILE